MKSIFLLLFLITGSYITHAQQGFYILTGQVLHGETGSPMQGASVFAENTTIGTATDADGNFKLWLPNGGHTISVTYTGFSTVSQRSASSDADKHIVFAIRPREVEISDVVVVSSNEVRNGWEKYGSFFFDQFIGTSLYARSCVFRNPEVLKFYFSKKRNRLKIVAADPLLIQNNALGYNIRYSLDSFTHEYATGVSFYSGNPLFEDVTKETGTPANIAASREAAYKGSVLHFMRGIYHQTLQKDSFEIQFVVRFNEEEKALPLKDFYKALNYKKDVTHQTVTIRPNQTEVGVIYLGEKPDDGYVQLRNDSTTQTSFQFSILSFQPQQSITIEQNGYFFDQSDLVFKEYWTWEKVGDMVPYDYGIAVDYQPAIQKMIEAMMQAKPEAVPQE
ncbi:MAG TPA: carboxypeptidase-like regulatory domain-containing protein [Ferruginibacter sp.]|nr:carboxypeptidase-like regulatory domain-containing protein [Ferruginibacter sp.]